MEILEAYCVELNKIVEVYEASEAFFDMPQHKRKRLTFLCSDNECREALTPLIVGANYDKLVEVAEKYRQPYFRTHDKHPHLSCCKWLNSQAEVAVKGDGKRRRTGRTERAKQTDVVDAFNPKKFDPQVATEGGTRERRDGKLRGEPYRERDGISETSRLERFVDCWSNMSPDARQSEIVALDGKQILYSKSVLHVSWISPAENGARVIYGGARARFWPADTPQSIFINFMDECKRFPENNGSRLLSVELPLSRINDYRGGAVLLERLKASLAPDCYLKVYAWGEIRPMEKKLGYSMEISSLDNLVIKAIKKGT